MQAQRLLSSALVAFAATAFGVASAALAGCTYPAKASDAVAAAIANGMRGRLRMIAFDTVSFLVEFVK
ncbi:hypothetical protein [Cupriavidus campinensis]